MTKEVNFIQEVKIPGKARVVASTTGLAQQLTTKVIMSGTAKITTIEYGTSGIELRRHVVLRVFQADYDHDTDSFKLRAPAKAGDA